MKQERLLITSFGNTLDELRTVDLVELTACSNFDGFQVDLEAFAVDVICSKIHLIRFKESTRVLYLFEWFEFSRSDWR